MKKPFLLILILLSLGGIAQDVPVIEKSKEISEVDGKSYYLHQVGPGQTLFSISKVYGVSIDEITLENPILENGLKSGQVIRIPVISREEEVLKSMDDDTYDYFYHVASRGEYFSQIAHIYQVPLEGIQLVNPDLKEPLREGDYVKIPVDYEINQSDVTNVFINMETVIPEEKPEGHINHIVKEKETLYRISVMYGVEIHDITELNPGLTHKLSVGQLIKIPVKPQNQTIKEEVQDNKNNYIEHEVVPGETIYRIAMKYRVSVDEIRDFNNGQADRIMIGQIIKIPRVTDEKSYILHRVEERKTKLAKIADDYGVDLQTLKMANPTAGSRLYFGQLLRVPLQNIQAQTTVPDTLDIVEIPLNNLIADTISKDFIPLQPDPDRIYRIALMLPFILEKSDSLSIDQATDVEKYLQIPSFRFIQFYEGFLLAVDSLVRKGMRIQLNVFDVDQEIAKTIEVLQNPELSNMDIIVGPVFSKSFELTSNFARLFDIPLVNPFTKRSEVISSRPNVFKVKPAFNTQIQQVVDMVMKYYTGAKIIVLRNNKLQFNNEADSLIKVFRDTIDPVVFIPNFLLFNKIVEISQERIKGFKANDQLLAAVNLENQVLLRSGLENQLYDSTAFPNNPIDFVFADQGIDNLLPHLSLLRKNILITLSNDKVFTLELLTNLNVLRDTFDLMVIGLPDWDELIDYSPEMNLNVNLHLLTSEYFDYNKPHMKSFIRDFRDHYRTEPASLAFEGFDIGMYFLDALYTYGKGFIQYIDHYSPELLVSQFLFKKVDEKNGFENQHWNIVRFKDYKIENFQIQNQH